MFRKREQKYKFCSLLCSSRYQAKKLRKIPLPLHSKKLAEFIGICLGDGYTGTYQTEITLNAIADKEYISYVIELIKRLFPDVTLSIAKKMGENAITLRINAKQVSDFLKKQGIIAHAKFVPAWILNTPTYRKSCMRGLFDTEGSISFKVYAGSKKVGLYKQLNFRNTNMSLMAFVRDSLLKFGYNPTRTMKKSLYLSNHDSIARFGKEIGFGNQKLQERSLIMTIDDFTSWQKKVS